jgi:hypothetical protein
MGEANIWSERVSIWGANICGEERIYVEKSEVM